MSSGVIYDVVRLPKYLKEEKEEKNVHLETRSFVFGRARHSRTVRFYF